MIDNKNILAVIPARSGSKGVPGKNKRLLDGKPLFEHSVIEAKKSNYIDKLVVSTDDEEIINYCIKQDYDYIRRPEDLAQDGSSVVDALIHAHNNVKEFTPDIIVMLQPTTPFRKVKDIDRAIKTIIFEDCDSVVSVHEAPNHLNPHWVRKIKDGRLIPYLEEDDDNPHIMRQDLPSVYWRNGQIYIIKSKVLLEKKDLYGEVCMPYIMKKGYNVNIDEETDFLLAEKIVEEGLND